MSVCFAYDCNHRAVHSTCKFFRFPKDMRVLNKWKERCRRQDTEPKYFHRLCSCHFVDGLKSNGPTLFDRNKELNFKFSSPEKRRKRLKQTGVPDTSENVDSLNIPEEGTTNCAANLPPSLPTTSEDPPQHSSVELPSVEYLLETLARAESEIAQLRSHNSALQNELDLVKTKKINAPGNALTFSSLRCHFPIFHYYTGLPDYNAFQLLLKWLSSGVLKYYDGWRPQQTLEDQLLLTLIKLRLNPDYTDLSTRFQVSRQGARNIFLTIAYALHHILFPCIKMPSTLKNRAIMSSAFSNFSNCRCIVDCTEIQCAVPRNSLEKQSKTFSHYKNRNTFKGLIACSPHGAITFVSHLFSGSVSDKAIFKECGIISNFVEGDLVLADKGFLISDLLPPGVSVNIPPFLKNKQFTENEAKITTEIARARIHIERVIGRFKTYNILDFVPVCLREHSNMIFQLVGCLINLHPPVSSPFEETVLLEEEQD